MVDYTLDTFYANKKIFLTGHTGFKGSWMLTWLHSMGCIVKGYALAPENKNDLFHIINGASISESILSDIRDKEKLKQEIIAFEPDIIFHLAAQPLVRASYADPLLTFETNVLGTANVLESVRVLKKKCAVVIITTDKVYSNLEIDHYYSENDHLGGYDPYSASKAAAELICDSYRNSFFNPNEYEKHKKAIATARAGNVIGGGDWSKDRIIPDVVTALQKGETIKVRNPEAVRPWQHVLEPVGAYLLLAKNLYEDVSAFSSAWNFGPDKNDTLSVREVVVSAIKEWGNGSYETTDQKHQVHEANLLKLDIHKACTSLGWQPAYSAAQAIEKTIAWYKQPKEMQREFTYLQLSEFRK